MNTLRTLSIVGFQSTHPRGVRLVRGAMFSLHINFNPRTHVGCDALYIEPSDAFKEFQSTHPRGVRRNLPGLERSDERFQSTHPRGVRPRALGAKRVRLPISIHAPTWGATRANGHYRREYQFQSTHPRGVRLSRPGVSPLNSRFQSTHPRGVRLLFTPQR